MNLEKSSRPLFFYQNGRRSGDRDRIQDLLNGPRIRIVYPNGNIEWATSVDSEYLQSLFSFTDKKPPCYLEEEYLRDFKRKKPTNIKEALDLIKFHDKQCGYKSQEFLGYL